MKNTNNEINTNNTNIESTTVGLNNLFTYHNFRATYSQNILTIYNEENKLVHSETYSNLKDNLNIDNIENKFHHYVDSYNDSINAFAELPE